MKKRILSLLLALVLCLGLSVTAFADYYITYPHLEIGYNGGTDFSDDNNPRLSNDISGDGWSWTASTYTLTLDNIDQPNLTLYVAEATRDVTIVVKGTCNMYSVGAVSYVSTAEKTSTLTGSGTLKLTSYLNVDVVDGPTVSFVNGSFKTLKSGIVTKTSTLMYDTDIQNGCLIVDARQYWIDNSAYIWDIPASALRGSFTESSFSSCTMTDENGSPVSLSEFNEYYTVSLKADGTAADYVKITGAGYSPFSDVKAAEYYGKPVIWAVDKKITTGTSSTTFSPENTCTRGQIITFLWRAAGCPEPTVANPFTDVPSGEYYEKAAVWAYEQGMASGSTFSPTADCTRAMAVEFMWKYAGSPSAAASGFGDVSSDASYSQAVGWALTAGVTTGTSSTTFSPEQTCTRGQIVTFLYRAFANK